jgi:uncharacterized membrane protein
MTTDLSTSEVVGVVAAIGVTLLLPYTRLYKKKTDNVREHSRIFRVSMVSKYLCGLVPISMSKAVLIRRFDCCGP